MTSYKVKEPVQLINPSATANFIRETLSNMGFDEIDKGREMLIVLHMDARQKCHKLEIVSIGTANEALVHPREVYRRAVIENNTGVIIAHNHPSGDCTPSANDNHVTNKIYEAGKVLSIPMIDHVVVNLNGEGQYSYKANGWPEFKDRIS